MKTWPQDWFYNREAIRNYPTTTHLFLMATAAAQGYSQGRLDPNSRERLPGKCARWWLKASSAYVPLLQPVRIDHNQRSGCCFCCTTPATFIALRDSPARTAKYNKLFFLTKNNNEMGYIMVRLYEIIKKKNQFLKKKKGVNWRQWVV